MIQRKRENGEQLWVTLPNIAHRHDLDSHRNEVHGLLEEVLRRLSKVEHRCDGRDAHLSQLDGKCRRELATQGDLFNFATRLDDGLSARKHELNHGLTEVRDTAASELSALRQEVTAKMTLLAKEVSLARADIDRLTEHANELSEHCIATYTTKKDHTEKCVEIDNRLADLSRRLETRCDILQDSKMSSAAFNIEKQSLEVARERLAADLADTELRLRAAVRDIDLLAYKEAEDIRAVAGDISILQEAVASAQQQLDAADEIQRALRREFDADHQHLEATATRLNEVDGNLITVTKNHSTLDVGVSELRSEVEAVCNRLREDFLALDRREASSWERFIHHRPWPAR